MPVAPRLGPTAFHAARLGSANAGGTPLGDRGPLEEPKGDNA